MSQPLTEKAFYTLEEIAQHLDVNYQLIYRLARSGELPAVRVGRVYRVSRENLDSFLKARSTATGFACASCGKTYQSSTSRAGEDPETGAPICFDCVQRQGIPHPSPPSSVSP